MFNYSKNSILACKLDINKNFHIIKCPKLLPCGYTCCFDCIKSLITDGGNRFQCKFCKKIHRIPKDLERSVKIEHALDNSLEILAKEFSMQSKNDAINLKDTLKDYENNIENLFEFILQDIEISVESMKLEVDNIKENLFEKTSKIRDNYRRKGNKKIKKLEILIESIRENNDLYVKLTGFNDIDINFVQSTQQLSSNILIGTLTGSNIADLVDVHDIQANNVKIVKLKFNPYDICNCFGEYLAVTDRTSHKIHLLNKKFQLFKTITSINNEFFNSPAGICTNKSNVLLCDSKNQRILVIDKEFKEIKQIFKNDMHIEEPQNICCDPTSESVFVLDVKLNSVIQINVNGDFLNKFSLYIKNPISMQFLGDKFQLVINSNYEKICFYNSRNGNIDDFIENFDYSLGGLFYSNGYLYTHQANGFLTCFTQELDQLKWSNLFERLLIFDSTGSWSSCDFNKQLVFSLWNKSLLVI